tara:strand:+ start:4971 stop:5414 length:444 start_codon:yes stop_codon:yes gene_type:complete
LNTATGMVDWIRITPRSTPSTPASSHTSQATPKPSSSRAAANTSPPPASRTRNCDSDTPKVISIIGMVRSPISATLFCSQAGRRIWNTTITTATTTEIKIGWRSKRHDRPSPLTTASPRENWITEVSIIQARASALWERALPAKGWL